MTAASPTPMSNGSVPAVPRRTSQRQALRKPPSRQAANRRSESSAAPPAAPAAHADVLENDHKSTDPQQQYNNDSSDDEIPVPMKLSALTKALLSDGGPQAQQRAPSPPRTRRRASNLASSGSGSGPPEERRHLRSGSMQAIETRPSRPASPPKGREVNEIKEVKETKESSPPPARKRVVKLSSTPKSLGNMGPGKRRSASSQPSQPPPRETHRGSRSSNQHESQTHQSQPSSDEKPEPQPDVNTPQAQGVRVVRIAAGSSANRSRANGSSSFRRSGSHMEPDPAADPARDSASASHGSESRPPSNGNRSMRSEDNQALQGSMRVKRVSKVAGSFLSGPARRGRRQQSEGEVDGNGEGEILAGQDQDAAAPDMDQEPQSSFYATGREFVSGSPVAPSGSARRAHQRAASQADIRSSAQKPSPLDDFIPEVNIPFKLPNPAAAPAPRPQVPSAHDQENELPSAMKRSKSAMNVARDGEVKDVQKKPLVSAVPNGRATSPERKALAPLAQNPNTPHRPAPPPPPKMSVLQAATANGGAAAAASTTQSKQRRNILRVNGKSYTRLDCLGRGGSAKVYRVTAENGHMFALKRVSLEQADEATIKGYKGEIDLLGKLTGVDRVINLFDYEMNEEKKMLTLLMEMGELDLNSLIRNRQNPDAARFDPVFVRFYWKEMLECLQSVHQFDIVHSDLKPANFVLVKGRLKLIDFGIANAIQTDETVNVHREAQIGTPNYMSPESLMDFNNPRGAGRGMPGRPKLMKLGKPSDVWSLGCILYQMVYGVPPFGHIANPMARCQAIINWDHAIEFPSRASGGVPVPPSLLRTMKRCLNREIDMRPTCEELLHETDPFLNPTELHDKALPIDEELLGRIIQSVVTRCKERMPTEAEARSVWPGAYWQSVKKATDASRTG